MDAKKAIEEGRSYLLVMTDRRMKPDEADAKKMQKIEKFIEKTERKKLPSPKQTTRVGEFGRCTRASTEKYNKNESVDSWGLLIGSSAENQGKPRFELRVIRDYTMKSLILAQDER